MHDWTLLSILFEWKTGRVTLEFKTEGPELAKLIAHGVSELHVPRLQEWGPSVSVNKMLGPSDRGPGRRDLEIEMQSGDRIRIAAASFDVPHAAYTGEKPAYATALRDIKIVGDDIRRGEEFMFTAKPTSKANATFVTVVNDEIIVTRRASDLFGLPDDHPIVAHWHGTYRTDGFATDAGELKRKAGEFARPSSSTSE